MHRPIVHSPFLNNSIRPCTTKRLVGTTGIIQSVTVANIGILYHDLFGTMKLDDWLTRLVAVPPGRSPLANGLAIGMRIALFILIPLGIIAAIAIVLLHR